MRLNRPLKTAGGHDFRFFAILSTTEGIQNKVEPSFVSYWLFSKGTALSRKPFKSHKLDPTRPCPTHHNGGGHVHGGWRRPDFYGVVV